MSPTESEPTDNEQQPEETPAESSEESQHEPELPSEENLEELLGESEKPESEKPEEEEKPKGVLTPPAGVFVAMLVLANIFVATALTLASIELYQFYWPRKGAAPRTTVRRQPPATPKKKSAPKAKTAKPKPSKAKKGGAK